MNRNNFQNTAKQFRAGKISLEEFTEQVLASEGGEAQASAKNNADSSSAAVTLPARAADSHKGQFGKILIIGGSRGMAGAAALTGSAALRSGSGLVTVATSSPCVTQVAQVNPCFMTLEFPCDSGGRIAVTSDQIREICLSMDVVAIGPGLGRSADLQLLVSDLFRFLDRPMVLDADALFALSDSEDVRGELVQHEWPRILTPHAGEFKTLTGSQSDSREELCALANDWADSSKCVFVLKGHQTLVTDGKQNYVNQTGNPGMATAGSGDVLTGVITSLLGQGMEAFDAAKAGVYMHGLAGDLGAAELGQPSLIATDLIDYLPQASQKMTTV